MSTKTRASGTDSEHKHTPTPDLYGWITHTELASSDPQATRSWCAEVLGWDFMPSFPTPAGEYHLYSYSEQGGGGIRKTGDDESPGCTPFVHVANTDDAYARAVAKGALGQRPPETIMPGVRIALVKAPGGVLIGLSGPGDEES